MHSTNVHGSVVSDGSSQYPPPTLRPYSHPIHDEIHHSSAFDDQSTQAAEHVVSPAAAVAVPIAASTTDEAEARRRLQTKRNVCTGVGCCVSVLVCLPLSVYYLVVIFTTEDGKTGIGRSGEHKELWIGFGLCIFIFLAAVVCIVYARIVVFRSADHRVPSSSTTRTGEDLPRMVPPPPLSSLSSGPYVPSLLRDIPARAGGDHHYYHPQTYGGGDSRNTTTDLNVTPLAAHPHGRCESYQPTTTRTVFEEYEYNATANSYRYQMHYPQRQYHHEGGVP